MAPPYFGGASHDSPPPSDFGPRLLTSTTTAEWRVLSLHVEGDEDARSEPTPIAGMFLSF